MDDSFEILRYSVLASAHLVSSLKESEIKRVNQVILFGSAARFSATRDSDIDIFFDVSGSKRFMLGLRSKLNKAAEEFYLTNAALEFKSGGIGNEISLKVGNLTEWRDLEKSISLHSIILYGKYVKKPQETKAYAIFSWEKPGRSKGALLNKIYGYSANKKRYSGMLKEYGGTKLGKAVIMVPAENKEAFIEVFEKYKVNYSRQDVWK